MDINYSYSINTVLTGNKVAFNPKDIIPNIPQVEDQDNR